MMMCADEPVVQLCDGALDLLMPLHAVVSVTGHIRHAGPTLQKLNPGVGCEGVRFLELFELRRPRTVSVVSDLISAGPQRLNLRLRSHPDIPMKGVAVPLPGSQGLLVSLSFGISSVDAINIFNLTGSDFAATDLTTELLYVVESKNAVMEESRDLNMRLEGAKSAAEEQAHTDTLTGLKNRRAMDLIMARYKSCRERFSLVHLDLDFFKAVNDTLGHAAGDHVLKEAAKILQEETRGEDSVIRFGGDEFVLMFHRLTDPNGLARIAGRILSRLAEPIMFEGHECKISGSMGITMSDDYAEIDPEQMMIDADVALYASKEAGRAQYRFVREVGGAGQSAAVLDALQPLERAG